LMAQQVNIGMAIFSLCLHLRTSLTACMVIGYRICALKYNIKTEEDGGRIA
ncbi:hypothetical protein ACJX0J_029565, partial [Zea mays]